MKNLIAMLVAVVFVLFTVSDVQAQLFRRSSGCANGTCSRNTNMSMSVSYTPSYSQPATAVYSQPAVTLSQPATVVYSQPTNVVTYSQPVVAQTKIDTTVRERPVLGGTVVKSVITDNVPTPTVVNSTTAKSVGGTVSIQLTLLNL